jgi:hypothetical protein
VRDTWCGRWRISLPHIAARDFNIPRIRLLPPTDLPLGDEFEPSPVKMVGFQAPFRCRGLIEQGLEHAPTDTHDALIVADTDAELDGRPFGVPSGVWGKLEEHCDLLPVRLSCSLIVLKSEQAMSVAQGERIPSGFILITGIDGIRYAVRHNSVAVIHDADECRDETLVQLHGGAVIRVLCSLDEVLAWFV